VSRPAADEWTLEVFVLNVTEFVWDVEIILEEPEDPDPPDDPVPPNGRSPPPRSSVSMLLN